MEIDVVELTQRLVRIPSVNPMGHDVEGEIYLEHRVTDFLQSWFEQQGLAYERTTVDPGRDNIVAILPSAAAGTPDERILVLEAHQDTVPIDGMVVEPFGGHIDNGRLYGRGSVDIKGGMATMLACVAELKRSPTPNLPTIVLACTINEECGFTGATALARQWRDSQSKLISRIPDAMIVSEPTGLQVVVAHKGVVRWKCHTSGVAAHSSRPMEGDNAIYRMADVLQAIRGYDTELFSAHAGRELLEMPTISVGTIEGGVSVNTVADHCVIEIDRRLTPGQSPHEAREALIQYIASHIGDVSRITHEPAYMYSPGLVETPENQRLAQHIIQCAATLGILSDTDRVPYGTNCPPYHEIGIPTVVFGPGDIAQAHTKDEFVEVEALHQGTAALVEVCRNYRD